MEAHPENWSTSCTFVSYILITPTGNAFWNEIELQGHRSYATNRTTPPGLVKIGQTVEKTDERTNIVGQQYVFYLYMCKKKATKNATNLDIFEGIRWNMVASAVCTRSHLLCEM